MRTLLAKFSPAAIASCAVALLTIVLTVNSNSSGCFIIHQPKAPQALDSFKKIK